MLLQFVNSIEEWGLEGINSNSVVKYLKSELASSSSAPPPPGLGGRDGATELIEGTRLGGIRFDGGIVVEMSRDAL